MEAWWKPPRSRRRRHVVASDDQEPGSTAQIVIRSRFTDPCRLLTSRRSAVRDRHRPFTNPLLSGRVLAPYSAPIAPPNSTRPTLLPADRVISLPRSRPQTPHATPLDP